MPDSGSGDSINLDLIDLNSSSSDSSSGELYEPSNVLRKARKTIEQTDKLLGSTRYFLRYRATNTENAEHPEQHQNAEHPEQRQDTEHPDHRQITENLTKTENPKRPKPRARRKNQQYTQRTEHHRDPNLQIGKMEDQQISITADSKVESPKVGVSVEVAMRVVPNFDGTNSDQVYHFLRVCDFEVKMADPEQIEMLVQGLIIKLSGRALRSIRYKDITSYKEFRRNIVEMSETKQQLPQLHMKLLTCKKGPDKGGARIL
ncbi:hypothetical protein AGLY_011907 [Aphis glycines]|uniref:Uncharacterized protein n=1 Tax=Aphis glycines TaxID=307491 RepID=A0A6G0TAW4_APHGL|nr:hypothetical protein AGLY_011907 [Aphis glycines]